ncbi:MAG: quinolinate synthase NadA [Firmicutes bacterium]|nr:quinolinate synthase NadA [Bacillota bacterium]
MVLNAAVNGPRLSSSPSNLKDHQFGSRIQEIRDQLGTRLLILGHHYQPENVVNYADLRGDSFLLARQAAKNQEAQYIVFLGVRFMAETADIVTSPAQVVMLPAPQAGCMMADMATAQQVREAWETIDSRFRQEFVPITYVNSSADVKAFCGENGGLTCTSSSAAKAFRWVLEQDKRIFFLPDEHLGRNTGVQVDIGLDDMAIWDRYQHELMGSNNPRLILWNGYCPIHQQFTADQARHLRQEHPGIRIMVHPECPYHTVSEADANGSTEAIISQVQASAPGSSWGIGTEINLVKRLAIQHRDQTILSLDETVEPCPDMMKITPESLLWCLEGILKGEIRNQVTVKPESARWARVAIGRMLDIGC